MKKKILLLLSFLAVLRALPSQNPDSCDFLMKYYEFPNGSATIFACCIANFDSSSETLTYLWSTGETTPFLTVSAAGTYCLTLTTSSGCSSSNCLTWNGPPPCSATIYEDSSSTLVAGVWNAQWPLTYLWNTGATTQTIQSSGPGQFYCVTITDASGCTATDCITTTSGDCTAYVSVEPDSFTNTVTLTANANGVAPFSYLWSNGATTAEIVVPFSADTFSVTVTDTIGCVTIAYAGFNFENCSVSIYQPTTADIAASFAGWGPATYLWSTGATGQSIAPVFSGNYCVTATGPFGCTATACYVFVGAPPPGCNLSVNVMPDPTSGHFFLTAVPENGTPPYNYLWNYGGSSQYFASGQSINYAYEGYLPYKVTVTDAAGCAASAVQSKWECQVVLKHQVDSLGNSRVYISTTGVGFTWYSTSDGWVGGTGPGGGLHIQNASEPGPYCVTITDDAGCQQNACIEIPECAVTLRLQSNGDVAAEAFGEQPITVTWSDPSLSGAVVTPPAGWTMLHATIQTPTCSATDTIFADPLLNRPRFAFIQKYPAPGNAARLRVVASKPEQVFGYYWDSGETGPEILSSTPGIHCVSVVYNDGKISGACYDLVPNDRIEVKVAFGISGQSDQKFGDLWLIQYDSTGGVLTALDTVPFTVGKGFFENVPLGAYLIKASVGEQSTLHPNYIPSYWENHWLWNGARTLNFTHPFGPNFALLRLVQGQNPGGPGFVGGFVSQGANLQAGSGEPEFFGNGGLPGVSILLTLPDGTPVAHVLTDASGAFAFPNLAFGTYRVWVDIPGLGPVFKEVVLSPANPSVSTLSVLVDDDSANFTGTISTGEILQNETLSIRPNPAVSQVSISMQNLSEPPARVSVVNSLGQLFFEKTFETGAPGLLPLEISSWPGGQYFVVVNLKNGGRLVEKLTVVR